ncbi:MAG: hypothetical protein GQ532_08970 [Methylomarinum sp.]|nr:hypothetical protein [Methylomarinum sp.]
MGAKSDIFENDAIDCFIRGQAKPALPANWYVGLAVSSKGKHAVSTAYALNDTLFIEGDDNKWRLYKCTTAGTTAGTKPSYPGVNNEVITDGGVAQFTQQHAGMEDGSALVEPVGNGYARVAIPASLAAWAGTQGAGSTTASTGTSGTTSNNVAITFASPTGDWDWCGLFVLYDAITGGNHYISDSLSNPMNITNGMTNIEFAPGQLQYTEDD